MVELVYVAIGPERLRHRISQHRRAAMRRKEGEGLASLLDVPSVYLPDFRLDPKRASAASASCCAYPSPGKDRTLGTEL
ncbi:MAG: hypothetical protein HYX53_03345 [Chloroflexi bacterium]|nr:hypothetical protein [Chloroflexota bacterium]